MNNIYDMGTSYFVPLGLFFWGGDPIRQTNIKIVKLMLDLLKLNLDLTIWLKSYFFTSNYVFTNSHIRLILSSLQLICINSKHLYTGPMSLYKTTFEIPCQSINVDFSCKILVHRLRATHGGHGGAS